MRFGIILSTLLLTLFAQAAQAGPGGNPADRTREMSDVMKAIASAPEGGKLSPEQEASNCKRYTELDGYFDYDTIVGTALASVSTKMGKPETTEFKSKFRELIRLIAYPDSGSFFRRAKSSIAPAKVQGVTATVIMESVIEDEDFRNSVRYTWAKQGDTWRITDIAFDNASLVKDYQNQFKRIVDKEGAAGLMKRLNTKHAEEKAKRLVCGN